MATRLAINAAGPGARVQMETRWLNILKGIMKYLKVIFKYLKGIYHMPKYLKGLNQAVYMARPLLPPRQGLASS